MKRAEIKQLLVNRLTRQILWERIPNEIYSSDQTNLPENAAFFASSNNFLLCLPPLLWNEETVVLRYIAAVTNNGVQRL